MRVLVPPGSLASLHTLILVGYLMKDLKLVEQLLTLTFHSCYLSCVHVVSRKDGKVCV